MDSVKFIKEPGYIYDLYHLFLCYFSKQQEPETFSDFRNFGEETEFVLRLLEQFGPFSDELLPFFCRKDKNVPFMMHCYFRKYKKYFRRGDVLSAVLEDLRNHDQVIEEMLRFYFPNLSDEEVAECRQSPTAAGRVIKNSQYNGDIKAGLFAFFLEPAAVIQKLSNELIAKEFLLSQTYDKSLRQLMELQNEFSLDEVWQALEDSRAEIIKDDKIETIYVSFCRYAQRNVSFFPLENGFVFMLGSRYRETLSYLHCQKKLPNLELVGKVLSEKNRIEILDLLLQRGEICMRDIEQVLGFSGTNAYYHLTMMQKAEMIKTSNRGRVVYYRLNPDCFKGACKLLSRYAKEPSEE